MIRNIQPIADHEGNIQYYSWVKAVLLIPSDALGGYIFARMAANQGMPISNYHAACSAGAVFGTLTWLARAMTGVVAMIQITRRDGTISNVFGVYEQVQPDPVIVTEEEHRAMRRGIQGIFTGLSSSLPSIARRSLGCFSCCCGWCLVCCGMKDDLDTARAEMREWERSQRDDMADVGYQLTQQMLPATRVD